MNTVTNKIIGIMNVFEETQCGFSFGFEWQNEGSFVLHENVGNTCSPFLVGKKR